jgi:hypothetical protein
MDLNNRLARLVSSRIAIGMILAVFYLFFFADSALKALLRDTGVAYALVVVSFVLFILSRYRYLTGIANILLGVLMMSAAFGLSTFVSQLFEDGRIMLVALFLVVAAVYLDKSWNIDL